MLRKTPITEPETSSHQRIVIKAGLPDSSTKDVLFPIRAEEKQNALLLRELLNTIF